MLNTKKQIQKSGDQSVNIQAEQICLNLNFPLEEIIRNNGLGLHELGKILRLYMKESNLDKTKEVMEITEIANDIEKYIKQGRLQNAKDKLKEIQDKSQMAYRDDLLGFFHFIEAHCDRISGEYIKSIKRCNNALRFLEEDEGMAMRIYNLSADNQRLRSNYNKSLEFYEKVLSFQKNNHNKNYDKEYNKALLGKAKLYRLICNYKESLKYYKEAFEEFEAFKDTVGISEAFFGMGEIYRLLSKYSESLFFYKESLGKAIEDENFERQAYSLWGIGEILRITGRDEEAKEKHLQGIEFCKIIGDTRSNGWGLLGMAEIDSKKGYYDKSMKNYIRALLLFKNTDSKTEIAHSFLGIAESNRMQGKIDIESYNKAIEIYKERKMEHCLIYARIGKILSLHLQEKKTLAENKNYYKSLLIALEKSTRDHFLARESYLINKILKNKINPCERIELNFP
jgi:tetratricopeptide (TPR) repeat protein